jgi:hypothetical protein
MQQVLDVGPLVLEKTGSRSLRAVERLGGLSIRSALFELSQLKVPAFWRAMLDPTSSFDVSLEVEMVSKAVWSTVDVSRWELLLAETTHVPSAHAVNPFMMSAESL